VIESLRRVLDRIFGRSRRIETKLDRVLELQERTMNQIDQLIADFDAETTAVAAQLDAIRAELAASKNDAVTPAQLTALDAISARLKALGADPAQPIPPAPPAPV
jgi:septal ring factor EnvC (AmiA/AmiB activator)